MKLILATLLACLHCQAFGNIGASLTNQADLSLLHQPIGFPTLTNQFSLRIKLLFGGARCAEFEKLAADQVSTYPGIVLAKDDEAHYGLYVILIKIHDGTGTNLTGYAYHVMCMRPGSLIKWKDTLPPLIPLTDGGFLKSSEVMDYTTGSMCIMAESIGFISLEQIKAKIKLQWIEGFDKMLFIPYSKWLLSPH